MTYPNWNPNHPYLMSTEEIEEELRVRAQQQNAQADILNYHRIGELEKELAEREWDYPSDVKKEIARD